LGINAKIKRMKKVAVTMGDPLGIGPEIIVKALLDKKVRELCAPIVIGDASVVEKEIRSLKAPFKVKRIGRTQEDAGKRAVISVIETGPYKWERRKRGPTEEGGRASYEFIKRAVELAMAKEVDAICTAPISKEALRMAGIEFPGHTELLAYLTGTKEFAMMLTGGPLKVILVTTHAPLKEIPFLISKEKILEKIILAKKAARMMGIKKARIAVCGLNPHAGEGGTMGDEEINIIAPAIAEANKRKLRVTGPYPADTLFRKAYMNEVDIVLAMYHDQGLAPLKMIAFDTGVNITLGLPFIRTSPDHGTAYDIAGKGIANPASMIEAVKTAATLLL
jgi:4-hydroxythreonine-4-phosphate dehydrogenase